jgi:serine/threonine protein kinase
MVHLQPMSSNFGQYELREQVGKGGMGTVYRAYQSTLSREVAVKILSIFLATDKDLKRFQYEAKVSATLEHPNIVPVYDFGTHDEVHYVVMRLLTGGSLSQRVGVAAREKFPQMSLEEIAEVTLQLASALDYAHGKGIIHRDVKPANILFDDHNVPYLVDFGIVKLIDSTSLTGSDEVVGSLPYIAPEQLRGGSKLTPAVDQYGLAATVYMMLTDHLPHDAESPYILMNKRLNEPPTPLQTHRPDLPKTITKVMNRALETQPSKRFENVSAFAFALYEAIAQHENLYQTQPPISIASRSILRNYAGKTPPQTSSNLFARLGRFKVLLAIVLFMIVAGLAAIGYLLATGNAASEDAPCRVSLQNRAYIRSGPSTDSDQIRAYDPGWTTTVVGKVTDSQGAVWWYVEVASLNANYWVADEVTREIGDCSDVPIVP